MVTPVIVAVTYEVLQTVPQGLREASLAVGATRWQTIKHAVLPKALPGVIAAIVLGFSRAFGETIAVMMVVGNVPQMPTSIFDPAYPLPGTDRQQLRRDDVDSDVRCGLDGRGLDLAVGDPGVQSGGSAGAAAAPRGGRYEEDETRAPACGRSHLQSVDDRFVFVCGGRPGLHLGHDRGQRIARVEFGHADADAQGRLLSGQRRRHPQRDCRFVVSGDRRDDAGAGRERADRVVSDDLRPADRAGQARCGCRST